MKKSEHTPGPWKVAQDADGSFTIEPETAHRSASYVAVLDRRGCRDQETREANAHLIATAPALLAAMRALYEQCAMIHKHWGDGCNQKEASAAIAAGRAAIAAAEGSEAGQ